MGNKLGRRRPVVDEKYTRPQGLFQHKDVDFKKLRKLILDSKLAPCYPGDDECSFDLEESPICFLYYPSLNRSRCCMKGVCTECFLQMKTPNSTRPTLCPFCKTFNYAVEYRGVKSKEERGMEQLEEQKVIEAKIRMRQQELQGEEERIQKRQQISSSGGVFGTGEVAHGSIAVSSLPSAIEGEEIVYPQDSCHVSMARQHSYPRQTREVELDLNLEDIMVMEAIWLSIQENDRHHNEAYGDGASSQRDIDEEHSFSMSTAPPVESSSLPFSRFACAIAALTERQQTSGPSSSIHASTRHDRPTRCSSFLNHFEQLAQHSAAGGSVEPETTMTRDVEWDLQHGSPVRDEGASCWGHNAEESTRSNAFFLQGENEGASQSIVGPRVPECFEEQMMLTMAVSLAEAQDRGS